eukprot:ANDGO_04934.mRNA.1 hypothetical protein
MTQSVLLVFLLGALLYAGSAQRVFVVDWSVTTATPFDYIDLSAVMGPADLPRLETGFSLSRVTRFLTYAPLNKTGFTFDSYNSIVIAFDVNSLVFRTVSAAPPGWVAAMSYDSITAKLYFAVGAYGGGFPYTIVSMDPWDAKPAATFKHILDVACPDSNPRNVHLIDVSGLVVDSVRQRFYVSITTYFYYPGSWIQKYDVSSSSPRLSYVLSGNLTATILDIVSPSHGEISQIYVADSMSSSKHGNIYSVDVETGDIATVVESAPGMLGIATDGAALYWTSRFNPNCAVYRTSVFSNMNCVALPNSQSALNNYYSILIAN